jgi:macrolide-specific efflux system membrane fusion protein
MKLPRPIVVNVTLAAVIVAAGVGVYFVANPITSAVSAETTQLTGTVQQGQVSSTITASGSIAATREVSAAFAVSGTLASVNVALGATVTAGDTLGTINSDDLVAARTTAYNDLAEAQEALADANTDLTTANAAVTAAASATSTTSTGSNGASSSSSSSDASQAAQSVTSAESAISAAEDKVDTATAAVTAAEAAVTGTTLTAPISGLVIAINNVAGDTISAGSNSSAAGGTSATTTTSGTSTGFVTIADVSAYTMSASIAEADIATIAVGQVATVTFPALDDVTAAATVTAISPTATASNSVVTYATTITLSEVPTGLRLGQTAEASITTVASAEDSLYVPTAAITTATDGTSTVEVLDEDDVSSDVTVELGVVGDEGTEIVSGVTAGQTVVLGEVAASTDEEAATTGEEGFGGQTGGGTGTFPGGGTAPSGGFPGQ